MPILPFKTSTDFRQWLLKNHDKEKELWIVYYKKASDKQTIKYKEAVDEALCFGWIDGVANAIDDVSYKQRFTPRTKKSIWSQVNIRRVAELTKAGRMHESGLMVFKNRDPKREKLYSAEQKDLAFDPLSLKRFKANKKAWAFFQSKPPSYQKPAIWWIVGAKKPETKEAHLQTLIQDSEAGRTLKHLTRKLKK